MSHHRNEYRLPGLAERAAQRRKDRRTLAALNRPVKDYPKHEQRDRHRVLVFLATLPTKELVAVHKAALQLRNQTTTTP